MTVEEQEVEELEEEEIIKTIEERLAEKPASKWTKKEIADLSEEDYPKFRGKLKVELKAKVDKSKQDLLDKIANEMKKADPNLDQVLEWNEKIDKLTKIKTVIALNIK